MAQKHLWLSSLLSLIIATQATAPVEHCQILFEAAQCLSQTTLRKCEAYSIASTKYTESKTEDEIQSQKNL